MNNLNEITMVNDDWDRLPFAKNWQDTLKQAKVILQQNLRSELAEKKYLDLENFVDVLIRQGDAYEDVVLKTSIIYFVAKTVGLSHEDFKYSHSDAVVSGVEILLGDNTKSFKENLDQIFLNTTYRYLGKIKVAEYVAEIKNAKKSNDLPNKVKFVAEVDCVLSKYAETSHKNLIKLLKTERKEF